MKQNIEPLVQDVKTCPYIESRYRTKYLCKKQGLWCNCEEVGHCLLDKNGKWIPLDNSPEACAARLAEMKAEEDAKPKQLSFDF